MTQLVELRDARARFEDAGLKLYAISYDDQRALADFVDEYSVTYTLLSDADSAVIRKFGILNADAREAGGPLAGIPYPGTYIVDEDGIVTEKFFRDSYKQRESSEVLIDSALGRVLLRDEEPRVAGGDDEIRVSVSLHGGGGVLKQGAMREVVVRFELRDGLHIYAEGVPEGMLPTRVEVKGPAGLVVLDPVVPPAAPLRLASLGRELPVWSGTVDIRVPVYAVGELLSEVRPIDNATECIEVNVSYQACDEATCRLPRTESFALEVPTAPVHVQPLSLHAGHGQYETTTDSARHMRRLFLRKLREDPLGILKFARTQLRLEREAKRRARAGDG